MDEFSLRVANMLVRNNPNDACLETTLIGPELETLSETQIAITGGDLAPLINGQEAEMWKTLKVKKGATVSFRKVRNGCRAYLSVRGGINVPMVLGSRSTYIRCEIGGVHGRQLKAGDTVKGFNSTKPFDYKLSLIQNFIPSFNGEKHVRVLLGPQLESFTQKGVETFLSNPYSITLEADRMGYRLEGLAIEHKEHGDIISDAILPGSVQVPSSGKPIITMQDAQTTGGYAKIAAVITSDLHILGQAKPKDTVHFHKVTLSEAHQRLLGYKKRFQIVEHGLLKQPL